MTQQIKDLAYLPQKPDDLSLLSGTVIKTESGLNLQN